MSGLSRHRLSGYAPAHQPAFDAFDGRPFVQETAHFGLPIQLPTVDASVPLSAARELPSDGCGDDDSGTNLKARKPEKLGEIRVEYLARHLELADELARWSWREWRVFFDERGRGSDDARRSYRERAQLDALPLALVAVAGDELIGTVSLMVHDLPTRPEITPWLASLFVVPEWRRRGVASLLIARALAEARRLDAPTLFLWTSSAEALYVKSGWATVERSEYCGKRIVIMRIESAR